MAIKSGRCFFPGQRVILTQQIPQRNHVWATRITGQVVRFRQRTTGSWFAHAKDSKLWLDRLTIRKDDGEMVECVLDPYTHVEIVREAGGDSTTAEAPADRQGELVEEKPQ